MTVSAEILQAGVMVFASLADNACSKEGMVMTVNAPASGASSYDAIKRVAVSGEDAGSAASAAPPSGTVAAAAAAAASSSPPGSAATVLVANAPADGAAPAASNAPAAVAANPPAAPAAPAGSSAPQAQFMVDGMGATGSGQACGCSCLCGVGPVPAGVARGNFGGVPGNNILSIASLWQTEADVADRFHTGRCGGAGWEHVASADLVT
jgi:hypothetical protein